MAIQDFVSNILPKYYAPVHQGSVNIMEHDSGASVKRVTWINSDFFHLTHDLAKDMKPFFEGANSPEIFRKDCDGIIFFEKEGKKYMFLTELKSKFDSSQLFKAKTQIISSFIKANMLFHLSPCYRIEEYIIKGFIVSHAPTSEFIVNLRKADMLPYNRIKPDMSLALKLFLKDNIHRPTDNVHKALLTPVQCSCLSGLRLGDRGIFPRIELYHISVPEGNDSVTLNIDDYIKS